MKLRTTDLLLHPPTGGIGFFFEMVDDHTVRLNSIDDKTHFFVPLAECTIYVPLSQPKAAPLARFEKPTERDHQAFALAIKRGHVKVGTTLTGILASTVGNYTVVALQMVSRSGGLRVAVGIARKRETDERDDVIGRDVAISTACKTIRRTRQSIGSFQEIYGTPGRGVIDGLRIKRGRR